MNSYVKYHILLESRFRLGLCGTARVLASEAAEKEGGKGVWVLFWFMLATLECHSTMLWCEANISEENTVRLTPFVTSTSVLPR